MEKMALALMLIAVCAKDAAAIHCFDCNSVNNSMCLDPSQYDQETLVKYLPITACGSAIYAPDQQGFFCRKIVQTIFKKGYEPEVRVTRGCGWVRHHKDCYKADNEDHLETVCQCFADGCNHAAALSGAGVLLAAVATARALL